MPGPQENTAGSYGVRVKGQSKPTEIVDTFLLSDAEIPDRLN